MDLISKYLKNHNISFAIIKGIYNQDNDDVKADVDVVLKERSSLSIFRDPIFRFINLYRFQEKSTGVFIDLYCQFLSVGYYYYLQISNDSYDKNQVSELEYKIYLILDPLLKFSKYQLRHKKRLRRYSEGELKEVFILLNNIIGVRLSKELYNKIISNDFDIPMIFIKKCKFKLLFINGNFVRMCKCRFLGL